MRIEKGILTLVVLSNCFWIAPNSGLCGELRSAPFSLEFAYNYYYDRAYFDATYDSSKQTYKRDVLFELLASDSTSIDSSFHYRRYDIGCMSQQSNCHWLSGNPYLRPSDRGVVYSAVFPYEEGLAALIAAGAWYTVKPRVGKHVYFVSIAFYLRDLPKLVTVSDALMSLSTDDCSRLLRNTDPPVENIVISEDTLKE